MVRYLQLLLVLALALGVTAQSSQPKASCNSLPGLRDIPISLQETEVFNMDQIIKGFNIDYSLSKDAPDFVYLKKKFEMRAENNITQKGLKSYHLDHTDNDWGTAFITLTETNFTSTIRWGKLNAADQVPTIQGTVIVENEPNVDCFDAIRFDEEGLAMVDCALKVSNGEGGFEYLNRFMYVDLKTQTVLPAAVETEIYVPFQNINHRRLYKFTDVGYHYLVRIYFADGIDTKYRDNTYMEIMAANNPRKPFILRVIDRSFLDLKKLSITDFHVYLGDMYILDYHSGVIKFDITPSQQIVIAGKYRTDSGFRKMGVYSDNLDNQFLLVLANSHAIYEVDWTNQLRPEILTKYSIMENSRINSLWVNRDYVVVQAEANTTGQGFMSIYNSTWVFTRGSRTYSQAYVMLPHDSENTYVDFNRDHSFVMSIDEESIQLWALDTPRLSIIPTTPDLLNQEFSFTVKGISTNPVTGESLPCVFPYKLIVVKPDNYTIWQTGIYPPTTYHANYPGELYINLQPYVLGPNITFGIQEQTTEGPLPNYWILQQNSSNLVFDKPLSLGKITFLRQEQYDSMKETDLVMYLQDANSKFVVAHCTTEFQKVNVNCTQVWSQTLDTQILNMTANRFHYYGGRYLHLGAFVLSHNPNSIIVENLEHGERFATLRMPDGYEGKITDIQFGQHYLFAVLKYAKTIVIWDMIRCQDFGVCNPVYEINADTMYKLGIKYFAPLQVYTSDFHPFVLFIQTTESVIILDITRNGPLLLDKIISSATKEPGYFGWKMALSHDHLVIVNPPNLIEEHNLVYLNRKITFLSRFYPLYNYEIPETFDLDFSDQGDLIYVTAKEKGTGNAVLLVYRAGLPTVATFFDVYNIKGKYEDVLVDATGNFVDYVLISAGSTLSMFRQFEMPLLVFENTFNDFSFNITYTNAMSSDYFFLSKSQVLMANFPTHITIVNPKLNDTNYLNSLIEYKNDNRSYVINDYNWFNGTILNYTLNCEDECGPDGKIKIVNHVNVNREVLASYGMSDYSFTMWGGVVQQTQGIIRMRHNGSIEEFVNFPASFYGERCERVSVDFLHNSYVSACLSGEEVYLYLTTHTSEKPFAMGPFPSTARGIGSIQAFGGLVALTDVDENPQWRARQGGVIIYALNTDLNEPQPFDELDIIDSNDFTSALGWDAGRDAYIGNSHLVWTNETNLYRLLVTEVTSGLFVVDFTWNPPRPDITVKQVSFVDLLKIMNDADIPLPNGASFEAVTVMNEHKDSRGNWVIDIVVSIRNFHNLHVQLLISSDHVVIDYHIVHVYFRYSYYESTNYLKSFDGYFVTTQTIPPMFSGLGYNEQVVAVYDTRPNRTEETQKYMIGKVDASHMLGAVPLDDSFRVTFDFNFTLRRNETDPFSNIGLVLVDSHGMTIREISISESIHITTLPGISKSQNVQLTANNDYSHVKLPITIHIDSSLGKLPWWAILLIVLGSVGLAAGIGYGIFFYYKKQQVEQPEIKKSLLEEEGQNEPESGEEETTTPVATTVPVDNTHEVSVPETVEAAVVVPPVVEDAVGEPVEAVQPVSREGAVNDSVNMEEQAV